MRDSEQYPLQTAYGTFDGFEGFPDEPPSLKEFIAGDRSSIRPKVDQRPERSNPSPNVVIFSAARASLLYRSFSFLLAGLSCMRT